jgi:hypothetical protein
MDDQKLRGMLASNALDCNNVRQYITLYDNRERKGFKDRTTMQMHNIQNDKRFQGYGLQIKDIQGACNPDESLSGRSR